MEPESTKLRELLGGIDIYLLDQILRQHIMPGMKILDAGCGEGRNLRYFFRSGYDVYGVDRSSDAIRTVQMIAGKLAPQLSHDNFRCEPVDKMSFADETFDVVISSAVLHFSKDRGYFRSTVNDMWRVLKTNGLFFARLSTTIGAQDFIVPLAGGQHRLPDGSEWLLVDEGDLTDIANELHGELVDPLKTTIVHNLRSMTTWVLRKRGQERQV